MRNRIILGLAIIMACAVPGAVLEERPARAQSMDGIGACVLTATTTATSIKELADTAGCPLTVYDQCVLVKVLGATAVCIGASGVGQTPTAGVRCYPGNQNDVIPIPAPAAKVYLRTNSGTSLVAILSGSRC